MKACLSLLLGLSLLGSWCVAQDPPKPGPELKFLAECEGNWDVAFETQGVEMKGTASYKMALGGMWLSSTLEMDMGGMPFSGQGLDSYDPVKKKYVGLWVDSMSNSPITLEGTRSADGKKITMTGKGPDPTGQTVDYKTETEYVSKDKHIFKMWMGTLTGGEFMKAVYTRSK